MKKIVILVIFLFALFPMAAMAAEGSSTWYGAWFNDWADTSLEAAPMKLNNFNTFITVANFNNYSTNVKVTYYQRDGSKYVYNNLSTFTHSIAKNSKRGWRPNNDLGMPSTTLLKGSYKIEAINGAVFADAYIDTLAGSSLPAVTNGTYDVNDSLSKHTVPLHTVTSSYLALDSFIHNASTSNDNQAANSGECDTWLQINNPSDSQGAEATVTYYNRDGGILYSGTVTLSPHQTVGENPGKHDLGTSGTREAGSVVIDVTKGSLIGNYATTEVLPVKNGQLQYLRHGGALRKKLVIQ